MPRLVLCPNGRCIVALDGVSLYSDESHLASSRLEMLKPGLREALNPMPKQLSGR